MREVGRAILMLCALSGTVRTLADDARGGDKQAAQVPSGYSSPHEAFQARRAAIARRDWRTSFSSMTPETQDQEEREEMEKLLKEHPELLDDDLTKFLPGEKPGPDLPETDMELMAKVMSSQLIDRAGLYEEAMEFLTPKVKGPERGDNVSGDMVFGDLQGVTVSGDTARGWVGLTQYVGVNGVKRANKPVRVLRRFRRLNGRWYNDNQADDVTRYDDPQDR